MLTKLKDLDLGTALLGYVIMLVVVGLAIGIITDTRFDRNIQVACARAGGVIVRIEQHLQCVTITPVPMEVVR